MRRGSAISPLKGEDLSGEEKEGGRLKKRERRKVGPWTNRKKI